MKVARGSKHLTLEADNDKGFDFFTPEVMKLCFRFHSLNYVVIECTSGLKCGCQTFNLSFLIRSEIFEILFTKLLYLYLQITLKEEQSRRTNPSERSDL